jgi:hypothetical protein
MSRWVAGEAAGRPTSLLCRCQWAKVYNFVATRPAVCLLYEQRLRFQAVKNMLPLPAQCWMTSLGGMTSPILLPGLRIFPAQRGAKSTGRSSGNAPDSTIHATSTCTAVGGWRPTRKPLSFILCLTLPAYATLRLTSVARIRAFNGKRACEGSAQRWHAGFPGPYAPRACFSQSTLASARSKHTWQ